MRFRAALGVVVAAALAGCDSPAAPPKPPAPAAPREPEPLPSIGPQEAWETRKTALLAADANTVWNSLCAGSRAAKVSEQAQAMEEMNRLPFDSLLRALKPYGLSPSQFRKMDATQFCLHMIHFAAGQAGPGRKRLEQQRFVRAEVEDGRAVCTIALPDGSTDEAVFVTEGGAWKLDDAETARRNGRLPQK